MAIRPFTSLRREQTLRVFTFGIRFFLTAALTASQTPGPYAPFALGSVAAAGGGAQGAAAFAGAAAGALLFFDFAGALRFLACAILIVTAAVTFRGTRLEQRPLALPVTAAAMVLSVGGIYAAQSLSPRQQLLCCAAAAVLTAVSAWAFCQVLRPQAPRALTAGTLLLAAALMLALTEVQAGPVSLGRGMLCALLVFTAFERGGFAGAAAGLGLGLVAGLCGGETGGLMAAAYGFGGLLAGQFCGGGRWRAAALFFAGVACAVLPATGDLPLSLLGEAAVGSVLFLLLPHRLLGGKRVLRTQSPTLLSAPVKQRLSRAAEALRELYDSLGRGIPQTAEENPAVIFDRAAERVCRECSLCALCWQKEYTSTFNALNDATPFLLERGRSAARDFPSYFSDRCVHLPEFMAAIDAELSAFLLRRQYRRQLEETRRSVKGQYAQLSDLLTATAAALETAPAMAPDVPCQVGAALRPKAGETACGDTVMSFCIDDGAWCLLLSDGMGSGEGARRESSLTCRLLRQFLEAQIEPEAALKTLNAAMALRGAETGSFTTVDLCVCRGDEAAFYKFGAAPSYLKKGGVVRRVTGVSLPVGLRGAPAAPDITRATLEPGSFVVLISDGVADPGRDDWLQDLLAGWQGEDPQALATCILSESVRRERLQDDCAVEVLYRPAEGAQKI